MWGPEKNRKRSIGLKHSMGPPCKFASLEVEFPKLCVMYFFVHVERRFWDTFYFYKRRNKSLVACFEPSQWRSCKNKTKIRLLSVALESFQTPLTAGRAFLFALCCFSPERTLRREHCETKLGTHFWLQGSKNADFVNAVSYLSPLLSVQGSILSSEISPWLWQNVHGWWIAPNICSA